MKHNIFKIAMWLVIVLGISSCEGYLGGDTNIDPNRTNDASLNTLTPTILFFSAESTQQAAVVANQYIQQIGSVAAGGTDVQLRNTFAGVFNNIYLNIIPNVNIMIKKAEANNSPHYSGLAKVVLAYNLGLGTSIWENIPFKSADNQLSDFAPKYDTQEQIYKDILRLLDEAITDLSKTESLFKPGNDDIVFRGNISNWLKTAHSLKARYLLHMAKKNGASSYAGILDALSKGIKVNSEDFQLIYNDRNLNRWYQVALANNTGNVTTNFSETFVDLMNGVRQGIADPRIPLLAFKTVAADTVFRGMVPGRASGANTRYNNGILFFGWNFAQLAPLQMVTNAESKFIEAEVRMLQNNGKATTEAYNAYLDGIRANMTKIGVAAAEVTRFTTHPNIAVGADKLTLSNVLVEKYKALFLNPEAWNDLRRYDYSSNIIPGLDLPELHNPDLKGKWIQRGHYPDSEASRNSKVATENFKELDAKMWIFN
jgi:hypothetical protein